MEYAKERVQFDKPLGAFQAIAHYLSDAATAVDGGKTLVYEAAWARSKGKSISRLAPMAKLFACQTYRDLTAMAEQVWGGVGFTIEYDIQLFFRRAKQLQLTWVGYALSGGAGGQRRSRRKSDLARISHQVATATAEPYTESGYIRAWVPPSTKSTSPCT